MQRKNVRLRNFKQKTEKNTQKDRGPNNCDRLKRMNYQWGWCRIANISPLRQTYVKTFPTAEISRTQNQTSMEICKEYVNFKFIYWKGFPWISLDPTPLMSFRFNENLSHWEFLTNKEVEPFNKQKESTSWHLPIVITMTIMIALHHTSSSSLPSVVCNAIIIFVRLAGVGWLSCTAAESLRAFVERIFANFRDKNIVFYNCGKTGHLWLAKRLAHTQARSLKHPFWC